MRSLFVEMAAVVLVACACGAEGADEPVLAIAQYPDAKRAMISLTYDDGTKDHYAIAAPLMEKYGYRGIFSIVPNLLGDGKYMSWDNVRDLKARGHEIANHSMSHPNLVQVLKAGNEDELKRQIVDSRDVFEKNVGFKPSVFCFPFTAFNEELITRVLASGQEPMMRLRYVFTSETTFEAFEAFLDTVVAQGQFKSLLFHGIDPKGRGWKPFHSVEEYERVLRELKSREDEVHVGGYGANMNYSKLRNAAELVMTASAGNTRTYRLALKEANRGLAGELAVVLGAKPLEAGDVDQGSETNGVGTASTSDALPPDLTKIKVWVEGKNVPLQTNALGVVYFNAAVGDMITLVEPSASR